VETTLVGGLLSLNLDRETEGAALAAFNKLLWIQNDYFAKYYANPSNQVKEQQPSVSCLGALTSPAALLPTVVGALAGGLAVYFGYLERRK
jgi:hypothetical protein